MPIQDFDVSNGNEAAQLSLPAGAIAHLVAIYSIHAISAEEWRFARQRMIARLRPGQAA